MLDQCSQKLHLPSAARRLYTEDGTHILHMDQLRQWIAKGGNKMTKGMLGHCSEEKKRNDVPVDTPNQEDKHERQADGMLMS